MGLLARFRRSVTGAAERGVVGPSDRDITNVRQALLREAERLRRREGLSLSLLLEHTDLDVTRIDIHAVLSHLEREGEIVTLAQDSFGNVRFDLTERLARTPG